MKKCNKCKCSWHGDIEECPNCPEWIPKLLEEVVSDYMKALGDEKLSYETWQKLSKVNAKYL